MTRSEKSETYGTFNAKSANRTRLILTWHSKPSLRPASMDAGMHANIILYDQSPQDSCMHRLVCGAYHMHAMI